MNCGKGGITLHQQSHQGIEVQDPCFQAPPPCQWRSYKQQGTET